MADTLNPSKVHRACSQRGMLSSRMSLKIWRLPAIEPFLQLLNSHFDNYDR